MSQKDSENRRQHRRIPASSLPSLTARMSGGAAVKLLQRALGMRAPYGTFDAATQRTVRKFQTVRHLPRTGVVSTPH